MDLVATATVNLKVAIIVTQIVVATKAAITDLQVAAAGALVLVDVLIQTGAACLVPDQAEECLLTTIPIQATGISKAEEAAQVPVIGASKAAEAVCLVQAIGANNRAEAAAITKGAICLQVVVAQCPAAVVLNQTVAHTNLVVAVHSLAVTETAAAIAVQSKVAAVTVI